MLKKGENFVKMPPAVDNFRFFVGGSSLLEIGTGPCSRLSKEYTFLTFCAEKCNVITE